MLEPKILRGRIFVWTLTQESILRIFIITSFQNQNDHAASTHANKIKFQELYE